MNILTGKTALVTGASRGIGRASALALAQAGAKVLVHYASGATHAQNVVDEIRQAGGQAESIAADLSTTDGAHALATKVRERIVDRLDILVANAGSGLAKPLEDTTVEEFDRLFAINVRTPFFLVQQLLPVMGEGSSIVLISSLAAQAAVGTLIAYAASKGAVETMSLHLAALLGERGIRVNTVAPGIVPTDMSSFAKTQTGRNFALDIQALKRMAEPDDIAQAVAFLASDQARWITGEVLHVDGGAKL
ncbi:SDR family NAD(P)-dependent oxidoreductase [Herbaspirillum seropedicae]|uniref:SDR family NAD(P)-dependent oxidoreductase n=1 Tax=Herbaspirillum seropedicae TaxID=964 RepID=UPI00286B1403|nr:SDR family oxidoreductase [Herbaspirillum seropedicae]